MSLDVDKLALGAEEKHNFTLLTKYIAFRLKVRESKENEKQLSNEIADSEEKLKFIE